MTHVRPAAYERGPDAPTPHPRHHRQPRRLARCLAGSPRHVLTVHYKPRPWWRIPAIDLLNMAAAATVIVTAAVLGALAAPFLVP